MSREFDLLVFGASGFTGSFVTEALFSILLKNGSALKWGVAGRSEARLTSLLASCVPGRDVDVPVVIADVNDEPSLLKVASRCKLLLNCVGPYRHFGEQVVKACVAEGTDYMDLCGEPEFLERIELKYSQEAKAKSSLVVSSCAFDSVPADIGFQLVRDRLVELKCIPHTIESFLSIETGDDGACGHYTTYECAVLGFGSQEHLKGIRKEAKKSKPELQKTKIKMNVQQGPFQDFRMPADVHCFAFPGADASVVKRTQEHFTVQASDKGQAYPTFQHACYFCVKGTAGKLKMSLFGMVFSTLAKWQWGRSLLLRYPTWFSAGAFSHEGPSRRQVQSTSFRLDLFGSGLLEESEGSFVDVKGEVTGPEPGYVATGRMFATLALVLLSERGAFPTGGVYTPGFVFGRNKKAVEQLGENDGCHFSIECVAKT